MSTSYPGFFQDASGQERFIGSLVFTSDTNQPVPQTNPQTSGALSTTSAWVSTTAKQISTTRTVFLVLEITFDGTANAASVAIALSPDNSTYSTVSTPAVSAAVNTVGGIVMHAGVQVPQGWYVKLTFGAHAAVAVGTYY